MTQKLTETYQANLKNKQKRFLFAENAMLKYLMKPDMSFIRTFNEAADTLRNLTLTRNTSLQEKIERLSEKIKADFVKLTQIIQGNLFLVNVVMAGSANEFLYLSGELAKKVTTDSEIATQRTYTLAESTQRNGELFFSLLPYLLALSAALFTMFRILGLFALLLKCSISLLKVCKFLIFRAAVAKMR